MIFERFSGRGIERLGFGIDAVVANKPDGIVSGFTYAEGYGGEPSFGQSYCLPYPTRTRPQFPPTLVMDDYIAGYLAAAGTIEALRRRATVGGTWHVHVNLARAAMWYASLGMFPSTDFEVTDDNRSQNPDPFVFQSSYGEVERLHPMVKLSRTPGKWQEPLQVVRGSDRPLWKDQL